MDKEAMTNTMDNPTNELSETRQNLSENIQTRRQLTDEGRNSQADKEEQNRGKIFVGGLSWETTEDSLRSYFEQFGTVSGCIIMRDRHTGHPRGFGFVTFLEETVADYVASQRHEVDGRQVEAKKAVPRTETSNRNSIVRLTKKIFVGGLSSTCSDDDFRNYFATYGQVTEAHIMYDHQTGHSRGFGFVTFAETETVERVFQVSRHVLKGKVVEVKLAEPKHQTNGDNRRSKDLDGTNISSSLRTNSVEAMNGAFQLGNSVDKSSYGNFSAIAFNPALASCYAQYYGGTSGMWEQYAAAAAAAASAGLGYLSPSCSQSAESLLPCFYSMPPEHMDKNFHVEDSYKGNLHRYSVL
eukprot:jgi/Galph1/327/GphlegSOOS_G5100.1